MGHYIHVHFTAAFSQAQEDNTGNTAKIDGHVGKKTRFCRYLLTKRPFTRIVLLQYMCTSVSSSYSIILKKAHNIPVPWSMYTQNGQQTGGFGVYTHQMPSRSENLQRG